MELRPALHVAIFGVYPGSDVGPHWRESLTAAKAGEELADLTTRLRQVGNPRLVQGAYALQVGRDEADALYTACVEVRAAAHIRLYHAYRHAAQKHWIKPVEGVVLAAVEGAEKEYYPRLARYLNGARSADHKIFPSERAPSSPVARVAYIRAVLNGETVSLNGDGKEKTAFLLLNHPLTEPALDTAWFDLRQVDTLAYCAKDPVFRTTDLMGYPPVQGPA